MTSPIQGVATGTETATAEIILPSPYSGLCDGGKARNDIVFHGSLA